jgi:hypothetical protein
MKYTIDQKKKSQFIWAFLLDQMADKRDFSVLLHDNDTFIEKYLIEMLSLNFIKIVNNYYKIDTKGQEFLDNFFAKYKDFLKLYDIFCAVDLTEGTFAFKEFYNFDTDEEWKIYLNQDNWEDVRVAVCEFKKIDPIEIVYLSFLNEGRFTSNDNWQFDLTSDLIWDEILNICETAIPLSSLSQDGVIEDIVQQGSNIMLEILKEENSRKLEELENTVSSEEYDNEVYYVEEETIYYEQYVYDPYYVSPCWFWYY